MPWHVFTVFHSQFSINLSAESIEFGHEIGHALVTCMSGLAPQRNGDVNVSTPSIQPESMGMRPTHGRFPGWRLLPWRAAWCSVGLPDERCKASFDDERAEFTIPRGGTPQWHPEFRLALGFEWILVLLCFVEEGIRDTPDSKHVKHERKRRLSLAQLREALGSRTREENASFHSSAQRPRRS